MSLHAQRNKTAAIERNSSGTENTHHELTQNWTSVDSSVACVLAPKRVAKEYENAGRIDVATHVAQFPKGTDIQPGDRVTISSVKYLVEEVHTPHRADRDLFVRADLRRAT